MTGPAATRPAPAAAEERTYAPATIGFAAVLFPTGWR